MTDAFDDLDSARARIRSQVQDARERTAAVTVLADQIAATTATVSSARGEVTVTATAGAQITDVTVADAALSLRADALGRLIRDTVASAQRAAAERGIAAAEETLGADSAFVAGLRADVESRFGELPGETVLR
jgi:DNA-binding protein YbaB